MDVSHVNEINRTTHNILKFVAKVMPWIELRYQHRHVHHVQASADFEAIFWSGSFDALAARFLANYQVAPLGDSDLWV